MQCRKCGIEIADKALICYRCGTSTTEARFKPHVPERRRSRSTLAIAALVLALLVLLAWLLLNSTRNADELDEPRGSSDRRDIEFPALMRSVHRDDSAWT
jgi:hypothetical protein